MGAGREQQFQQFGAALLGLLDHLAVELPQLAVGLAGGGLGHADVDVAVEVDAGEGAELGGGGQALAVGGGAGREVGGDVGADLEVADYELAMIRRSAANMRTLGVM